MVVHPLMIFIANEGYKGENAASVVISSVSLFVIYFHSHAARAEESAERSRFYCLIYTRRDGFRKSNAFFPRGRFSTSREWSRVHAQTFWKIIHVLRETQRTGNRGRQRYLRNGVNKRTTTILTCNRLLRPSACNATRFRLQLVCLGQKNRVNKKKKKFKNIDSLLY